MRILYLLLVYCILLTACTNVGTKSSSGDDHTLHKPTLDVKLEVSGNQLSVKVETDMFISPEHYGMARKDGEGHIHMYLDNLPKIGLKEDQTVIPDLLPGKHKLKVSLHNNDHTPYDMTKSFEFEI